jgi:hypothetical protein
VRLHRPCVRGSVFTDDRQKIDSDSVAIACRRACRGRFRSDRISTGFGSPSRQKVEPRARSWLLRTHGRNVAETSRYMAIVKNTRTVRDSAYAWYVVLLSLEYTMSLLIPP